MKVLVGSENPVKAAAVKEAFAQYLDEVEILAQAVHSQVSHQPVNGERLRAPGIAYLN